ncbi:hypothetical protein D3C79_854030 [compost metagenome]
MANGLFKQQHELGGQLFADVFQEQHLEEHRADEDQGGEQVKGQQQWVDHWTLSARILYLDLSLQGWGVNAVDGDQERLRGGQ